MKFFLPSLKYSYSDLEPYFDAQTMEIHHTKHHQSYINALNINIEDLAPFNSLTTEVLIKNIDQIPKEKKTLIRNNAGGHFNHSLFWQGLKKGTFLHGNLKLAIERDFGDFSSFKELFEREAMNRFGSGWIWLVTRSKKLTVLSTANQDNPLMGEKTVNSSGYPILGLDVWEHAYYLKYQNRRLSYVQAFWNVLNWDEAESRFKQALLFTP